MSAARFYVLDRQAGQHPDLCRWSAVNPRYWIMDRTTGRDVDSNATKRAAQMGASLYNSRPEMIDGAVTA